MPLYRVLRQLGPISQEEIDAAAFRALACLPAFDGLAWLRSYYDPESSNMFCLYEAKNIDHIREHAVLARIPCDAVDEVIEYLPDSYR
jgi:hypothetical protein